MPSRSQPSSGAGSTIVRGAPIRRARLRMTASPSPRAPVTARSPRSMIAAFSRAIAVTVSPSRSMWSRSTFVIAATPPSQACVASSLPPRPTSTTATSGRTSAKRAKTTAVRSSNSVGGPCRRATRSAIGRISDDQTGEVVGGDRRAVDADPLAVGDEVRLRCRTDVMAGRTQRGVCEGQDASLAVGATDERSPDGPFRVPELAQERPCPPKTEADAEPASVGQGRQRLLVGEPRRRVASSRRGHSRVSSSS